MRLIPSSTRRGLWKPLGQQHGRLSSGSRRSEEKEEEEEELHHYPTSSSAAEGTEEGWADLLDNPFVQDPLYISRYRDPSRHDSYQIRDHHHPYSFRIRATATQKPPSLTGSVTPSTPARRARLSMEQSWLSPSSCQPAALDPLQTPSAPQNVAICFPGSSSQYMGMGSFLLHLPEFRHSWHEALAHLDSFHAWFRSLNLVDRFRLRGYSPLQAQLLGAPPTPSSRNLHHIVFQGPQNELSRCTNAQPAILITSMAYLRTLEVEGKMPLRSMAKVYAGHSSGEYTACVASNALSFRDGIHLTRLYGLLSERSMELAGLGLSGRSQKEGEEEGGGGAGEKTTRAQMSALLINEKYQTSLGQKTYDYQELIELVERFNKPPHDPSLRVEIASFNSSNQIVLSGTRPGVLAACAHLNDLEIANRAADLPCSSPFHSAFMRPAADGMKMALDAVALRAPDKPILITRNCPAVVAEEEPMVEGRRRRKTGAGSIERAYIAGENDLEMMKAHLSGSICRPVWWAETINELLHHHHHPHSSSSSSSLIPDHLVRPSELLFVGPGKALSNLCKKQIAFNRAHPLSPGPLPLDDQQQVLTRSLATIEDFHHLISS